MRAVDLTELVESIADLLQVSISKNVRLECKLEPKLPAVEGDAAQLTQVVLNLITNASEALGQETGTITVRTGVPARAPARLSGGGSCPRTLRPAGGERHGRRDE